MKNPCSAICGVKHGNKGAVWEVDKKRNYYLKGCLD